MRDCWARSLADCSGPISGEHIVTEALFDDVAVTVQGLPWCKDKAKTIGLSSLVKNVLCKNHNSRLSEADASAKSLRDALRVMASSEVEYKHPDVLRINGFSIERWCAKTLITFAAGTRTRIGSGRNPGRPSWSLVETAFGLRHFEPQAGLYWMGQVGITSL